ncbi:MAG: type II toxin-antitoxin system HicB family antitoxin [Candidatus Uhrbacteria bacterium]
MQREFTATYQKQGKWYLAWVEEVPGVNTQGRTMREARTNLREALQLILAANRSMLTRQLRAGKPKRERLTIAIPA